MSNQTKYLIPSFWHFANSFRTWIRLHAAFEELQLLIRNDLTNIHRIEGNDFVLETMRQINPLILLLTYRTNYPIQHFDIFGELFGESNCQYFDSSQLWFLTVD